jgi:hypothetical protein
MALIGSTSSTERSTIRSGVTKTDVGLDNVDNESKSTMFASPTFTGTVSGVDMGHLSGRVRTGSGDAAQLYTSDQYWQRSGNAGIYQSSGSTTILMRYSRYWWGAGNVHIEIFAVGYGPDANYGHFLCYGHTRNGQGAISTVSNNGVPTPYMTNWNGTHERCDVSVNTSAYYTYKTLFTSRNFQHYSTDDIGPGASGSNSAHCYSTAEVIT